MKKEILGDKINYKKIFLWNEKRLEIYNLLIIKVLEERNKLKNDIDKKIFWEYFIMNFDLNKFFKDLEKKD